MVKLCQMVCEPVKVGLAPTVERILQLFHQIGLAGHAEQPLLPQAMLQYEVHTLLHQ